MYDDCINSINSMVYTFGVAVLSLYENESMGLEPVSKPPNQVYHPLAIFNRVIVVKKPVTNYSHYWSMTPVSVSLCIISQYRQALLDSQVSGNVNRLRLPSAKRGAGRRGRLWREGHSQSD